MKQIGNVGSLRSRSVDVVLVRWPMEEERRTRLQQEGRARLLLVEASAAPPVISDCLEDWVRVPADDADINARVEALDARMREQERRVPELDIDGVLRFDGGWVGLPPVEARLMESLIARYGAVVSREQLARNGWPEGAPGRNALDVHVLRLRRRIAPLGLAIKTVRSRGYLLESDTAAWFDTADAAARADSTSPTTLSSTSMSLTGRNPSSSS
jgi:DNA-binding winged helix-turn-helix (wHTH) protein